jgi:hypothetical protein
MVQGGINLSIPVCGLQNEVCLNASVATCSIEYYKQADASDVGNCFSYRNCTLQETACGIHLCLIELQRENTARKNKILKQPPGCFFCGCGLMCQSVCRKKFYK